MLKRSKSNGKYWCNVQCLSENHGSGEDKEVLDGKTTTELRSISTTAKTGITRPPHHGFERPRNHPHNDNDSDSSQYHRVDQSLTPPISSSAADQDNKMNSMPCSIPKQEGDDRVKQNELEETASSDGWHAFCNDFDKYSNSSYSLLSEHFV